MTTTFDSHKNLAYSTVATAPSPATSGTSLVLAAATGALFPAPPFNAVCWPSGGATASQSNAEFVRVTAISTDTLTIIRAQEGSTAQSIGVGWQVALSATAKALTDIEGAINAALGGSLTGTLPNPGIANGAVGLTQLVAGVTPPVLVYDSGILIAAQPSFPATIPGGYRHLRLVLLARGDTAAIAVQVNLRANGDAGSDYEGEYSYAVGTAVTATDPGLQSSGYLGQIAAATAPAGACGLITATIPLYAGTTFRKVYTSDYGLTNADTTSGHVIDSVYGEWKSTAAITSLTIFPSAGNFAAGSVCQVYATN